MTDLPPTDATDFKDTPLADALGERYLSYALSTIMARSLPDVRDGLKPVHRRVLFAMRAIGLTADSRHTKSAQVVGEVIGKYHPHGDAAIYDAMVRLAQDFAQRYPLVDGQGNFGNIDGDNAAAYRYTEARLTKVAEALLDGLAEDAVDMRPTYDNGNEEPAVLPAAFPNLLANGATGIAVGMATSIPPHNAGELCRALLHLLHHPDATTPDLVRFVPGPDFPTGGSLVEPPESILTAYETGRGSFRTRARWQVEKLKNGTWQIIVTEIPYQVQKSRLIERIAELLNDKKLMLLGDVRDESAEDIRLVLEPRSRTVDPALLMESLFRLTDLETRFPLNLNVLDSDGVPRVMGLGEVLRAYLAHRDEVLIRRTNHRLAAIDRRLEILGGLLVAYLNLDEVIRIIREEDEPKPVLIERFQLTDIQATAILDMRLRHLRKLEEMEIRREHDQLNEEREWLHAMVNDPMLRRAELEKQLRETETAFGSGPLGNRRTSIDVAVPVVELPTEALVEKEPITVLCSTKGWVRALKGHDIDPAEVKYKDGDGERFLLKCDTTAKLLLFASDGKFYTLGADKLPRGRGFGEPVRLMIDLGNDQDIVAFEVYQPGAKRLLVASDGRGFLVNEDDALAQTRSGKQVMLPGDDATAIACLSLEGDHVAVIGTNRKLLIFPIAEIPDMARGRGVILQKYTDGKLSDLKLITLAAGLTYRYGEKTKTVTDLRPWLGKRASGGRLPPPGFPRTNRF